MSDKVILTREQAEAIERYKEEQRELHEKQVRAQSVMLKEWTKPLIELKTDEFMDAIYIGYEVEETFEVGGWVRYDNGPSHGYKTQKITSIEHGYAWFSETESMPLHSLRHATPEEVAKEKERRWWKSHNRDVWELKTYDVLINRGGTLFEVECAKKDVELWEIQKSKQGKRRPFNYVKRNYKVICFAEDRKDV